MTIIYTGLVVNFILLVSSWVFFFRFFKKKNDDACVLSQIAEIKKDLFLVTKNPAAARRKLKSQD